MGDTGKGRRQCSGDIPVLRDESPFLVKEFANFRRIYSPSALTILKSALRDARSRKSEGAQRYGAMDSFARDRSAMQATSERKTSWPVATGINPCAVSRSHS